jgi:hypothetical protein
VRFYVLCFADHPGIAPHVIAEVVRDGLHDDRATTLASAIAGDRSVIVTRAELEADPIGRRALEAWESGSDDAYDEESDAIRADAGGLTGLRSAFHTIVGELDAEAEPPDRSRTGKSHLKGVDNEP